MKKNFMQYKGLAWDDVVRTAATLKTLSPAPVAVWFVDCEQDYRQLMRIIQGLAVDEEPQNNSLLPVFPRGIPIRFFNKGKMNPETEIIDIPGRTGSSMFGEEYLQKFKKIWPYICHFPGVWIEMSDKTYRRLRLTASLSDGHARGFNG